MLMLQEKPKVTTDKYRPSYNTSKATCFPYLIIKGNKVVGAFADVRKRDRALLVLRGVPRVHDIPWT